MLVEVAINTFGATFTMGMLPNQNLFIRALAGGAGSYVADMVSSMVLFTDDTKYKLRYKHTSGYPILTVLAVVVNAELNLTSDAIAIFVTQLIYAMMYNPNPKGDKTVVVKPTSFY